MINFRTRIYLISFFSVIFFAATLFSFKGHVLCFGSDGHIHTEITFNGIDCGHFTPTASGQKEPHFLKQFKNCFHANHCISCTDIPLSLDFSLKKFDNSTNQRTASKLRTISSLDLTDQINPSCSTSKRLSSNHLNHLSPSLILIQKTVLLF
jgi:hypothetical protein